MASSTNWCTGYSREVIVTVGSRLHGRARGVASNEVLVTVGESDSGVGYPNAMRTTIDKISRRSAPAR